MPSTHVSLYYHIIFSTKGRYAGIRGAWDKRLYEYIGGIIRRLGGVAQVIGGTADHVHILMSLKATHNLSDVMRKVKTNSSKWIRSSIDGQFWGWQEGYGAFTVSKNDLERVGNYIRGQKEHHKRKSYKEEYINILRQCGLDFDEKYLW